MSRTAITFLEHQLEPKTNVKNALEKRSEPYTFQCNRAISVTSELFLKACNTVNVGQSHYVSSQIALNRHVSRQREYLNSDIHMIHTYKSKQKTIAKKGK